MFTYSIANVEEVKKLFQKRLSERNYDLEYKKCLDLYFDDYVSGKSIIFVVKNEEDPVGSIILEFSELTEISEYIPQKHKSCYLSTFKIEKQYEGQGHISKLCQLAEDVAQNLGYSYAVIACDKLNSRAKGIYKHFGYNELIEKESNTHTVLYLGKILNCKKVDMNDTPIVSIIIPVFNAEDNIRCTLNCLLHQTYTNFELILVDDESNLATKNILQEIKNLDKRVKIITQEHSGAGAARNNGLKNAVGKYVLFLDSDDLFLPNMIEILVEKADSNRAEVVTFGFSSFREKPSNGTIAKCLYEDLELRVYSSNELRKNIFQRTVGAAWNKFYNREYVLKTQVQFQNLPFFNDEYFSRLTTLQSERMCYIKDNLLFYRLNSPNNIHSGKDGSLLFSCVVISVYDSLRKKNLLDEFKESFSVYVGDVVYRALSHSNNQTNFNSVFAECRNLLIRCDTGIFFDVLSEERSEIIRAIYGNELETCHSLFAK